MTGYADLEVGLHRRDAEAYAVELRYSQPDSDTDVRIGLGQAIAARFDASALRAQWADPAAYGRALGEMLFADAALRSALAQARASAEAQDLPLRVRLIVGPTAPELHSLRWETLVDPQQGDRLFTNERLLFSRYLSSLDWRPVRLRPQGQLSALVFVANPSDLPDYNLAPLDAAGETGRARTALGQIPVSTVPADGAHATLDALLDCLRAGSHDILYIVCHGAIVRQEPWLWLEDAAGKVALTRGAELVARLKELPQRPRLMVLGSCESAGSGLGEALVALGPRLAEAGLPAVVAMQGKVGLSTLARFMSVFFREVQSDGQIDRAMAVARGSVRNEPDYWMPALFMRLKSGRIWYVPGFSGDRQGFEKWPALIRSINRGQCTPILGPGLTEPVLGSMREIAQRWAETYHYPLAAHERESLPQVAQYLAISQDQAFPLDELSDHLREELQKRWAGDLPPELASGPVPLDALIDAVGARRRAHEPLEAHHVLAQLPLPIYLTTNADNLLASALKDAGRDPQVMVCPWNEYGEQTQSVFDVEPDYRPTPQRPLVYHLLGRLSEPNSVVLTEDDYFDFLIGVTANKDLIPSAVRRALADTALLFLGFQLDDWNFRVLFRGLVGQQAGGRRNRYANIAAQIDPEEGQALEPERARKYLESYFSKGADISLYWGSADDFLSELSTHWTKPAQ
jgi:hypothetical protein